MFVKNIALGLMILSLVAGGAGQSAGSAAARRATPAYLGFDRNDYPGDAALAALRRTFAFTAYWLNNPPGAAFNTWAGKRARLEAAGFGFLVVFNGKLYSQLKSGSPAGIGKKDGALAAQKARREGFPRRTVIYLDQEQGGRQLPEQKAYIYAWVDAVIAAGFRAGVYCSGMPFKEQDGTVIVTANDLRDNSAGRAISYWVFADACPPSPGCVFSKAPLPEESGISFADVWQYAQSPRRPKYTAACQKTYNADSNCYPPGLAGPLHVDVNTATSSDPSKGRTH
jgi:hypothetical protein